MTFLSNMKWKCYSLPMTKPNNFEKGYTMSNKTITMTSQLHEYMLAVSLREPEILTRLREETARDPMAQMQIAPEQGQFMGLLIRLMRAKKVLEVGVYTGYSSLSIALALPGDGKIVACDVSDVWTRVAKRYWEEAGVTEKIKLHVAPAIQTMDGLIRHGESDSFDFVFIDADKENYDGYYERSLELLRPGGLIAIDNVFWDGRVADPNAGDEETASIRDLNKKLHSDDRIHLSMIPIADGLTLVQKTL